MINPGFDYNYFDFLIGAKQDLVSSQSLFDYGAYSEAKEYFCDSLRRSSNYIALLFEIASEYPEFAEDWNYDVFRQLYSCEMMQALLVDKVFDDLEPKMCSCRSHTEQYRHVAGRLEAYKFIRVVPRKRGQSSAEALMEFYNNNRRIMPSTSRGSRGMFHRNPAGRLELECEEMISRINNYAVCFNNQAILSSLLYETEDLDGESFLQECGTSKNIAEHFNDTVKYQSVCIDILYRDFINHHHRQIKVQRLVVAVNAY